MPAKGTKRITKQVFRTVTAQLRGTGSNKDIAAANNISVDSVRTIKRVKTWPAFERYKAAKVAATKKAHAAAKGPTKIVIAAKGPSAQQVKVRTSAPAPISNDDLEFHHIATNASLKAMEDRIQAHLDRIEKTGSDTHKIVLEMPTLHIGRRLQNMDQSLVRIERAVTGRVRRGLALWGRK